MVVLYEPPRLEVSLTTDTRKVYPAKIYVRER